MNYWILIAFQILNLACTTYILMLLTKPEEKRDKEKELTNIERVVVIQQDQIKDLTIRVDKLESMVGVKEPPKPVPDVSKIDTKWMEKYV